MKKTIAIIVLSVLLFVSLISNVGFLGMIDKEITAYRELSSERSALVEQLKEHEQIAHAHE
jgi:hypothetical protein